MAKSILRRFPSDYDELPEWNEIWEGNAVTKNRQGEATYLIVDDFWEAFDGLSGGGNIASPSAVGTGGTLILAIADGGGIASLAAVGTGGVISVTVSITDGGGIASSSAVGTGGTAAAGSGWRRTRLAPLPRP